MTTITAIEIEPWKLHGVLLFRWNVDRYNIAIIDERLAVNAWLESYGLDRVRAFAMFRAEDGRHLLAVTELCTSDEGRAYINHASDRPADRYRVLDLGTDTAWPDVLNTHRYTADRGKRT